MNMREKLAEDLKSSMKNQDKVRTKVLRMALSSIKLADVEKGEPLEDTRLLSILQKEVKTREETIAEAKKADRGEMIDPLKEEIAVLKDYLPKELTDAELEEIIDEIIRKVNAESIKQMGLVMKESITKVAGRASNDRISKIARSKLG